MSDADLLREYLATGSEQAFAELVDRYINLVYSAARRQIRDAHLADDITQAVFITLARKAAAIRNPLVLGPWLLKTTRQTSCNALRLERCRRRHEYEGAIMKDADERTDTNPIMEHIEGVLDEFLTRLGERDRAALALRFLQDKSVNDVATALHISVPAAQKRITRALARLREMLAGRGIATAGDALERSLCSQVLHTAPPGLALLARSGAIGKAAGRGPLLAQSTARVIFWAKIKALATAFAASGALMMMAAVAVNSIPDTRASSTGAAMPTTQAIIPTTAPASIVAAPDIPAVHLPNDAFKSNGPADEYLIEVDADTLRTPTSPPAGHIKSLIPTIPKDGNYTNIGALSATRAFVGPLDRVRGKRIRVSGWIKTSDVTECAGPMMYAYGDSGEMLARDDMVWTRPIHGTTDWQQFQMVQDIPQDATKIVVGATLFCTGELWMDDFQVQVVGNDVPVTDDQYWQMLSPIVQRYTVVLDPAVEHDGHATLCFASKTAPSGGWCNLWHYQMQPDPKYLGHRIRVTGWIKSSGVTGHSGLGIAAWGPWDEQLTNEGQKGQRPIFDTRDWKQYTAITDVPPKTKTINWAIVFNGRGKLWIDQDSVQIDLVDDAADLPPAAGQ